MTSATNAVEAAVFEALNGNLTVPVYQHVPEDTPPPVVIIGDIEASPLETKGDSDRQVSLTITTVIQAEQRKPVLDIQEEIVAALDGASLVKDAWQVRPFLESEDAVLLPDGAHYVGTSRYTIWALQ